MSLGCGAKARLYSEDKHDALYEYAVFDWNFEDTHDTEDDFNGLIWLDKCCLLEPKYHEKIKCSGNGKKKILRKLIIQYPNVEELIKRGRIKVTINSHSYRNIYKGMDTNAILLIISIFTYYQRKGKIPDTIGWMK